MYCDIIPGFDYNRHNQEILSSNGIFQYRNIEELESETAIAVISYNKYYFVVIRGDSFLVRNNEIILYCQNERNALLNVDHKVVFEGFSRVTFLRNSHLSFSKKSDYSSDIVLFVENWKSSGLYAVDGTVIYLFPENYTNFSFYSDFIIAEDKYDNLVYIIQYRDLSSPIELKDIKLYNIDSELKRIEYDAFDYQISKTPYWFSYQIVFYNFVFFEDIKKKELSIIKKGGLIEPVLEFDKDYPGHLYNPHYNTIGLEWKDNFGVVSYCIPNTIIKGMVNEFGDIVIPIKYHKIDFLENSVLIHLIIFDDKVPFELYDRQQNAIINHLFNYKTLNFLDLEFTSIGEFSYGYAPIMNHNLKGVISENPRVMNIPIEYTDIILSRTDDYKVIYINDVFDESDNKYPQIPNQIWLLANSYQNRIKLVNGFGRVIKELDIEFDSIYSRCENVYDPFGKNFYHDYFDYADDDYVRNFLLISKGGKTGIMDWNLNILLPIEYEQISLPPCLGSLGIIKKDGLYGVINDNFIVIIQPYYDDIYEDGYNNGKYYKARKGNIEYSLSEKNVYELGNYREIIFYDQGYSYPNNFEADLESSSLLIQ